MIQHPFSLFAPFADRFDVRLFIKEDAVTSDEELRSLLQTTNTASLRQMHTTTMLTVRAPTARTKQADGLSTNKNHLWLSVRAADCQMIAAYAPEKHVVGLLHVGWKNLIQNAIPLFFAHLSSAWDIDPKQVYVGIGPSLCVDCSVFTDPVKELPGIDPRFFHGRRVDLRGIVDGELDAMGIPAAQRQRLPDCTRCKNEQYWSYRGGDRETVQAGSTNVLACMLR